MAKLQRSIPETSIEGCVEILQASGTLQKHVTVYLKGFELLRPAELRSDLQETVARDFDTAIKALENAATELNRVTRVLKLHIPDVAGRGRN